MKYLFLFIFMINLSIILSTDDFIIEDEVIEHENDKKVINSDEIELDVLFIAFYCIQDIKYNPPKPSSGIYYYETFQDDPFINNRWYESGIDKYKNQEWKYGYGIIKPAIPGDRSLIIGKGGQHYAASSLLKFPIDNTLDNLIIQYSNIYIIQI